MTTHFRKTEIIKLQSLGLHYGSIWYTIISFKGKGYIKNWVVLLSHE